MPRTSWEVLSSQCFPIPSLNEQRAIAAFLDRETAKIDALIEKKKRLQDRLREKRATETFKLVTKGVRSVKNLRESGVEWIGEIPEHWSRARLLHVCRLETGHTPSRDHEEYWQNCTIPWVTLADVHQLRSGRQEYINGTSEKISELGLAHSAARLLPENTVILSRTASVGFAGIIPEPMATSQDFVNWICGPLVEPRYLVRCLWAMKDEFRRLTMGSTHQTIYMPDVKGLTIPLPPVEEQKEIVAESEKSTGWVARLNDQLSEQITHLREYRTALISAAVTGQIDVRGRG
jgi:type I restriction enzyme S subunit